MNTYTNGDVDRFTAKVNFPDPADTDACWIWQGAKHGQGRGYGKIRLNRTVQSAHKASYLMFRGDVPAGMVINHLCVNERCVNPAHLELCTQSENCKYMLHCGRHNSQGGVRNAG